MIKQEPQRLLVAAFLAFVLLIWVPLAFLVAGLSFLGYLGRKQIKTVFNDLKGGTHDR